MEIEQVKRARREMEDSIRVAVMEAIDTFNTKTSMYPEHIDIGMMNTATLGVHSEVTI